VLEDISHRQYLLEALRATPDTGWIRQRVIAPQILFFAAYEVVYESFLIGD
jgi:hypothetical protein